MIKNEILKIEINDISTARTFIDNASREYLLSFIFECHKEGLLRVLSGTDGQTIEALRRKAYAAIDNLFEDCVKKEKKSKLVIAE